MRRFVPLAAAALLILVSGSVWAAGPAEEMTSQMKEWVDYERPPFEPVEMDVDGFRLSVLDATIESHGLDEEASIVKLIMRARRGDEPARVTRAVLKGIGGKTYPLSYVKAPPAKVLEEQGFKSYTFRLREVDGDELKSLEVTVAQAKGGAGLASTEMRLDFGEQVRLSDLDFASFATLPAFFLFFYSLMTTSSAF